MKRKEEARPVVSAVLTGRELATILAALRKWQRDIREEDGFYPGIKGSWGSEFFAEHLPLTVGQIDRLCQRINCSDRPKILIEIKGGVCQAVFADNPLTEVILYDRDNIGAGDEPPCDYDRTVKAMTEVF